MQNDSFLVTKEDISYFYFICSPNLLINLEFMLWIKLCVAFIPKRACRTSVRTPASADVLNQVTETPMLGTFQLT